MPKPTQATRNIAIDTPLGEDVLLLRSFSGHEEISRLFEFDLDLLSEDYEINFDDIIGQNVTIRMELPEGGQGNNGALVMVPYPNLRLPYFPGKNGAGHHQASLQ